MKKFLTQALGLALVLSLLPPIPAPPGGDKGTPPDEDPGISVCGDEWDTVSRN